MSKTQRLLLVTAVAVLLCGGLGVWFFLMFWNRAPLLQVLPADRTEAFFRNVALEEVKKDFGEWFPILEDIPPTNGLLSIAIVRAGNTVDWIAVPEEETTVMQGRERVRISGTDVYLPQQVSAESLTRTEQEGSLWDDPSFLSLTGNIPAHSWAYVRSHPSEALPSSIASLMNGASLSEGPVLIAMRSNNERVLRFITSMSAQALPLEPLPPLPVGKNACVSVGNAQELLGFLAPGATDSVIGTALLAAEVDGLLNAELSLQYDLLPLLERPAAVCMGSTDTATPSILLTGKSGVTPDSWDRFTRALHESYRERGSRGYVERRMVEDKYEYVVVKRGSAMPETVDRTENGWQVRQTATPGSGRGILTARRGSSYLITTDIAWLIAALNAGPTPLPHDGVGPTVRSVSATSEYLSSLQLPTDLRPLLVPLMTTSASIQASLEMGSGIGSIIVQGK